MDVIRQAGDAFEVVLVSAGSDAKGLDEAGALFPRAGRVLGAGADGRRRLLDAIAGCGAEIAVNGIAGAAGLEPSMAVIETGADLALANKETLVMAGDIALARARATGSRVIPVDSEHSAIGALLDAHGTDGVDEIILTASGGPFRNSSMEEMARVTPGDALAHPTWSMGAKISIDSATMANKGLEVIEAARLFAFPPEKIKVVVHPQSVVHSMVRMKDGAVYAQLSNPDMRLPIFHALLGHGAAGAPVARLEFGGLTLGFFPPDAERFPLLPLAYAAVSAGGLYPCAYNAANEEAVAAFLAGRAGFLDIARVTGYIMEMDWGRVPASLPEVLEADARARDLAAKELGWRR